MSVTAIDAPVGEHEPKQPRRWSLPGSPMLWMAIAGLAAMSIARIVSGNDDLTSASTFGVALRTAAPIALAGLGGLYSERCGIVNIGLEGMMIMGTVFAGWWAWEFGPWMGLLGGILGGCLGGLVHALATVTFGVNHIVSGFAINIIAPGVARFMATLLFQGEEGGSITTSPGNRGEMGVFTMPFTSGGPLFGAGTPDPLDRIAEWGWFMVSDFAGFLKAMTTEVRFDVALMIVFFFATAYLLWRTSFGLRIRSAGEHPSAANSLGVRVTLYRYIGVVVSGGFAGFGGAVLVLNTRYSQGQTGGRGYLGLASLIVGNWRPSGVAAGAGLFGFFDGITQRLDADQLVIALILAGSLVTLAIAVYMAIRGRYRPAAMSAIAAAAAIAVYATVDTVPNELVFVSPFVVTLIVVAARGQASRAPAWVGIPWRKGQD